MQNDKKITFICNICDSEIGDIAISSLTREVQTCDSCSSTVRMRSIVHALTTELYGESKKISDIDPPRPDIVGIGMSCWHGYAGRLAHKIAFKNTYYHQEPYLDITNIPAEIVGTLDFVVSSDVFEHVLSPVNRAFTNARRLLKPTGVFIFTVPYFHPGERGVVTTENFPGINEFTIVDDDVLGKMLRNVKTDGSIEYFYNLVYHGGPGKTLEMRRFSEYSVLQELRNAGFNDISIYRDDFLKYGIRWPTGHSAPIAARVNPDRTDVVMRIR